MEKTGKDSDDDFWGKVFADRLKAIREEKNLTQEQLADLSGVSAQMIQLLETNKRGFTKESIAKLSKALRVTASVFFEDQPRKPSLDESLRSFLEYVKETHEFAELSPIKREFISALAAFDDSEVAGYLDMLRAAASTRRAAIPKQSKKAK